MSIEAMAWALDVQGLTPIEKLVLIGIANHAASDGTNAWPAIDTLAKYACVSSRTARRAVHSLEDRGLVRIDLRSGGDERVRADRRPNRYTVLYPQRPDSDDRSSEYDRTDEVGRPDREGRYDRTRLSGKPSLNHPEPSRSSSSTTSPGGAVLVDDDDERVHQALLVVAERKAKDRAATNPNGYKRSVLKNFATDGTEAEARGWLERYPDLSATQLADVVLGNRNILATATRAAS